MIAIFILSVFCSDINYLKKYHIGPKYSNVGINSITAADDITMSSYKGDISIQSSDEDGVKMSLNGRYLCRDDDKLVFCKDQSLNSSAFHSENYIFRFKPMQGGYRIKSPSRILNSSSFLRSLTQKCLEYKNNKLLFTGCEEVPTQIFDLEEVSDDKWFKNNLMKTPGQPSNEEQNMVPMSECKKLINEQCNSFGSKNSGDSKNPLSNNSPLAKQIVNNVFNDKTLGDDSKLNILKKIFDSGKPADSTENKLNLLKGLFGGGKPADSTENDDYFSKNNYLKNQLVDDYLNGRPISEEAKRHLLNNSLSGSPSDKAINDLINGRPISEEAKRHLLNSPLSNSQRDKAINDIINGRPISEEARRLLQEYDLNGSPAKEHYNTSHFYNDALRGSIDESAKRQVLDDILKFNPDAESIKAQIMRGNKLGSHNLLGSYKNATPQSSYGWNYSESLPGDISSFKDLSSMNSHAYKGVSGAHDSYHDGLAGKYSLSSVPVHFSMPINGHVIVPHAHKEKMNIPLQNLSVRSVNHFPSAHR